MAAKIDYAKHIQLADRAQDKLKSVERRLGDFQGAAMQFGLEGFAKKLGWLQQDLVNMQNVLQQLSRFLESEKNKRFG